MQWWSFTAPEFTVEIVESESSSVAAYCAIFHSTKHKSAQWVCGITELTARQAEIKCQQNWCRSAVKLCFCVCPAWFTHLEPLDASVIFRKEVVSPIFLGLLCFAQRCLLSVPKYRALKVMRNEREKIPNIFPFLFKLLSWFRIYCMSVSYMSFRFDLLVCTKQFAETLHSTERRNINADTRAETDFFCL